MLLYILCMKTSCMHIAVILQCFTESLPNPELLIQTQLPVKTMGFYLSLTAFGMLHPFSLNLISTGRGFQPFILWHWVLTFPPPQGMKIWSWKGVVVWQWKKCHGEGRKGLMWAWLASSEAMLTHLGMFLGSCPPVHGIDCLCLGSPRQFSRSSRAGQALG